MLKQTYTFKVEAKTEAGEKLKGNFEIKRPGIEELSAISAGISRMNQGEPFVSPSYEMLFTTIVTIEACGVVTPPWWPRVSKDSFDSGVVMRVGAEMTKARRESLPFRSDDEKDESEMGSSEVKAG